MSLIEYETECYGMKIENNYLIKVQKFKNNYDNENKILCVKPLETFLGKCDVCNMLSRVGTLDKSIFNRNSILLKISEENIKNKYVYIAGDKIISFITNDHFLEYISNMGGKMIPYSIAIGEENICILSPHCNCRKRAKIKDDELLKTNGNSIDPFDCHLEKHGSDSFEDLLEFNCIHSFQDDTLVQKLLVSREYHH